MKESILIIVMSIAWFISGYCFGKAKSLQRYLDGLQDGFDNAKRAIKAFNAGAKREREIIFDLLNDSFEEKKTEASDE